MKCVVLLTLTILYGVLGGPVEDGSFQEFIEGNRKLTSDVYKEVSRTKSGNFFVSPLSAEVVLALTNEGAKGNTASEVITALSLPSSKEKTRNSIKWILSQSMTSNENLELLSAGKIYNQMNYHLKDDFKRVARSIYNSRDESIDFRNKVHASVTESKWVEDKTNRNIKNLLKPEHILDDTEVVLINTYYFNGKLDSQFDDHLTNKKKFFTSKTVSVDIDTMEQTDYFNYYENEGLQVKLLELNYRGDDISMIIALPNERDGLKDLEKNIEELLIPQPLAQKSVNLQLPKFSVEIEITFNQILKNLGIKKLFADADLSEILTEVKDLYVSEVVQKTVIDVFESGTKAAAATAGILPKKAELLLSEEVGGSNFTKSGIKLGAALTATSDPDSIVFHADHPFLYFIKSKGVVLFVGRYTAP